MNEELSALRDELRSGFTRLDERFGHLDERLGRVEQRLGGVDERLGGVDERFDRVDGRLGGLDESVRHNGVLLEDLRDDIRQLADAHILLNERVERYREENEAAHAEILGLLRTSHRDLDRRVTRLEARSEEQPPES